MPTIFNVINIYVECLCRRYSTSYKHLSWSNVYAGGIQRHKHLSWMFMPKIYNVINIYKHIIRRDEKKLVRDHYGMKRSKDRFRGKYCREGHWSKYRYVIRTDERLEIWIWRFRWRQVTVETEEEDGPHALTKELTNQGTDKWYDKGENMTCMIGIKNPSGRFQYN
jgi:hypothetical protein